MVSKICPFVLLISAVLYSAVAKSPHRPRRDTNEENDGEIQGSILYDPGKIWADSDEKDCNCTAKTFNSKEQFVNPYRYSENVKELDIRRKKRSLSELWSSFKSKVKNVKCKLNDWWKHCKREVKKKYVKLFGAKNTTEIPTTLKENWKLVSTDLTQTNGALIDTTPPGSVGSSKPADGP